MRLVVVGQRREQLRIQWRQLREQLREQQRRRVGKWVRERLCEQRGQLGRWLREQLRQQRMVGRFRIERQQRRRRCGRRHVVRVVRRIQLLFDGCSGLRVSVRDHQRRRVRFE
jgi:hypothetical protein